MKAITFERYGGPEVLHLREIATPTPTSNQVLVCVHAASLNALDWRKMRADPFLARLDNGLRKPRVTLLGADVAGQVVAVGNEVTQFQPGDLVFGENFQRGLGCLAEYVAIDEQGLVRQPATVSAAAAAAVPLAGLTALQGLRASGRLQAGCRVLVHGASGGVGTLAVQIAKAFGAEVTGVSSARNHQLIRSLGANHVIDYTEQDFTRNGQQYDLILDAVGNRSVGDLARALAPQGACTIVGFTSMVLMLQHVAVGPLASRRGGKQIGMLGTVQPNQPDLLLLRELLEAGTLTPAIERCYPLHKTADAIRYLETGRARGKIIINVT